MNVELKLQMLFIEEFLHNCPIQVYLIFYLNKFNIESLYSSDFD